MEEPDELTSLKAAALDLYRVLHVMEKDEAPTDVSWQSLSSRADYAKRLFQQVAPHLPPDRYASLEARVQKACERASAATAERRTQDSSQPDAVQRIFFSTTSNNNQEPSETPQEEGEEEEEIKELEDDIPLVPEQQHLTDVQDLQKAQRDQIEQAISQMATQLKGETKRIHTTLQSQTQNLGTMEDLAAENAVQVSQVATDVHHHVSDTWKRAIGTWTMLLTMACVFVFCLLTIQVAPKRQGPCLFFCNNNKSHEFCRTGPDGQRECIQQATRHETPVLEKELQEEEDDLQKEADERHDFDQGLVDEELEEEEEETEEEMKEGEDEDKYGSEDEEEEEEDLEEEDEEYEEDEGAYDSEEEESDLEDEQAADKETKEDSTECEVDMNGECVPAAAPTLEIPPAQEIREAALRDFMEMQKADEQRREAKIQAVEGMGATVTRDQHKAGAAEQSAFPGTTRSSGFASSSDTVPRYQGRPFSPKDIRKAAGSGEIDLLKGYLEVKPEWVNRQDKNGWSALHIAARNGDVAVITALLEAGGDASLTTVDGRTAKEIAVVFRGEHHPAVSLFDKKDGESEKVENESDAVQDTEQGSDTPQLEMNGDAAEKEGKSPAAAVTRQPSLDDVKKEGSAGQPEGQPRSPEDVHWATGFGEIDVLKAYLNVRPEWANWQDENGWSAMHMAARRGDVNVIEALLEAGADVSLRSGDGKTAKELAIIFLGEEHRAIMLFE